MKRRIVRSLVFAFVSVAAVSFVIYCAMWARSYLRADEVDVGNMQHAVLLVSKPGSLFVLEHHTAPWTFRPFDWHVYVHSMPLGQDYLSGYDISGERADAVPTSMGFGWKRVGIARLLKIPYWFLVLVSGGIVLSWVRLRRSKFSIRSLLFAAILISIAIGVAVSSGRGSWNTLDVK